VSLSYVKYNKDTSICQLPNYADGEGVGVGVLVGVGVGDAGAGLAVGVGVGAGGNVSSSITFNGRLFATGSNVPVTTHNVLT
jgi:hypothetical protein